jgi:endonuclease YncB( thermonuclease family)
MRKARASNDPRFAVPPEGVGGDPRVIAVLPRVIRWTLLATVVVGLLTVWLVAGAETLSGRVVGITDGDTITVLVARQEIKVRLADVDAPESKQAFGTRSKQALSDLCFRKDARLDTQGKDRYGRTIATVYCAGKNANAEQVWQGMAWVFDRYAKPDSPLYGLQREARAARRGLWGDPQPVPPWEWRQERRERGKAK